MFLFGYWTAFNKKYVKRKKIHVCFTVRKIYFNIVVDLGEGPGIGGPGLPYLGVKKIRNDGKEKPVGQVHVTQNRVLPLAKGLDHQPLLIKVSDTLSNM